MDRSYPDRPFVGVGVVVYKGDEVLLIQRGKPPRIINRNVNPYWAFPACRS